ncbi:nucleoside deaminase [Euhalothece natronophila Z-M001]|uniref:tRNA-specific adenosine deaminase n=1 Tax=Euhalothece natronophila Z-M001 TaxID=522448 RepID=A0A5B8NKP1_9CHRO|nr:tRNA adenosine(34) deaminase TadA [Euhalothece natronophila]QDZ39556.1 nucleoside deaminase [Euhalothece natronophila Z-M001]
MQWDKARYEQHCHWMEYALQLAQEAGKAGEIPVGAVIVDAENRIIGEGNNRKERDRAPTSHAEIIAINQAAQTLANWHLNGLTLYVTLEPCPMCSGAIIQARLGTLVYGADDPKTGAVRSVLNLPDSAASNHHLEVFGGILDDRCREQLKQWFAQKRIIKKSPT